MKVRVECKGSGYRDINALTEFQGNFKDLSKENYQKLKKEIIELGFSSPIHIWRENILDGHQRIRTLKKMRDEGFEIPLLPIVEVEAKDEKEAKKKVLSLTSQFGQITNQGLYEFLNESDIAFDEVKESFRFPEIDFDKFESEFYKESIEGEDDVPDVKDAFVKMGEIWKLGRHRLLCGDSTDRVQVEKLMNGEKADMVYTDPPYGMNLDTDYSNKPRPGTLHSKLASGRKYDRGAVDDFSPSMMTSIFEVFRYCDEIFLWGADYYSENIPNRKDGSWVVWDKVTKADGVESNIAAFHGSNFELCWSKAKHKREIARIMHKGLASVENDKRQHLTQKPVALHMWFFDKLGKGKTNIVDLFLGSGSTLIACEKTNRKCFGSEIDPQYCQAIIDRWENFTGQKAILESVSKTAENQLSATGSSIQKRSVGKSKRKTANPA